jgi:hypothetical protein
LTFDIIGNIIFTISNLYGGKTMKSLIKAHWKTLENLSLCDESFSFRENIDIEKYISLMTLNPEQCKLFIARRFENTEDQDAKKCLGNMWNILFNFPKGLRDIWKSPSGVIRIFPQDTATFSFIISTVIGYPPNRLLLLYKTLDENLLFIQDPENSEKIHIFSTKDRYSLYERAKDAPFVALNGQFSRIEQSYIDRISGEINNYLNYRA